MAGLLVTIAALLATWALILAAFLGLGLLVRRLVPGRGRLTADALIESALVGSAAALVFAQLYNLVLPANGWLALVLAAAGLAGLALTARELRELLQAHGPLTSRTAGVYGGFVFIAVVAAYLAARAEPIHDTGLYHLPATLWRHDYPAVWGLANLHGRLGFHSSLFSYAAALDVGPWAGRPHHVVQGPFLLLLASVWVVGARRLAGGRPMRLSDAYALLLILPALGITWYRQGGYLASISPNMILVVLVGAAVWQALCLLESEPRDVSRVTSSAWSTVWVLGAAATVKLTVWPFAALLWLLVLVRTRACRRAVDRPWAGLCLALILVGVLTTVPWITYSARLSGYPFYPVAVGGLDVDWRVAAEQVEAERSWTRDFARMGAGAEGPVTGWSWLPRWGRRLRRDWGFVASGLLLLAGALTLLRRRDPPRRSPARPLMLAALLALVVWFVTAPDPRFALAYVWTLALLAASHAVRDLATSEPKRLDLLVRLGTSALLLTTLLPLLHTATAPLTTTARPTPDSRLEAWLATGLRPLPRPLLLPYETRSGLELEVPRFGNKTWAAPLLSTPHPTPGLHLRRSGHLREGFATEGPWKPWRFPNPRHDRYTRYVEKKLGEVR